MSYDDTRVYLPYGSVAHLMEFGSSPNGPYHGVLCGYLLTWPQEWLGTGSQAEYDEADRRAAVHPLPPHPRTATGGSMTNGPAMPQTNARRRLARWLRMKWRMPDGWRRRVLDLLDSRHPWWDWGHPVMVLVGTDLGGNWAPPEPKPLWYHEGPTRRGLDGYPKTTWVTYRTYDAMMAADATADREITWRVIRATDDGNELHMGFYPDGGFYGLSKSEVPLLRRYLWRWRLYDWFGLRTVVYNRALRAAVHQRKPFTCQATPARDSNGYGHWHCQRPRRHDGPHQYRAMEWVDGDRLMTKVGA